MPAGAGVGATTVEPRRPSALRILGRVLMLAVAAFALYALAP